MKNKQTRMTDIFLSVIIPAYNEESRLGKTLEEVYAYLQEQPYLSEFIVVDDGSTDQTAFVVDDFFKRVERGRLLRNHVNRGKGYSVRRGVFDACGEYLLFSDADLSTPIEEVEKLLRTLHAGADIAIGSRSLPESDVRKHQVWYREYMGKIFNRLARLLLLTKFSDTQCGFKCFQRHAARDIFARQIITHFSFDVEVLMIAAYFGYKIREVPVQWVNNPHSRVNALTDAVKMFQDLLKIRYNVWRGRYN